MISQAPVTFNRTAYGIEIWKGHEDNGEEVPLLIAPLMELKF